MKKWLWEKLGDLAQDFKSHGRNEESLLLEGLRFRHYCREGGKKECLFKEDDLKKIMVKKWGEVGAFQVWLVDGEVIRDQWDDDFIGGGNGYRYSYIPKDQIWIDRDTGKGDLIPYLYHELVEAILMRGGWDYSKAHEMAAWREGVLRSKKGKEERKFLKVAGESWYHISPRWRTESILEKGLIVGRENLGFTIAGNWAEEWYGVWPIFCSKEPWIYPSDTEEWSLFSVDLSGLKLAADLPSLIDSGAYLGEEGYIYWGGEVPEQLKDLDEDGEFKIEDFIYDKFFIEASIDLTGTVAVLESIVPERIKMLDFKNWHKLCNKV